MKTIPNRNLTDNFTLYEFIEGQLPPQGIAMNWKNISEMDVDRYATVVAPHAQFIRNLINREFRNDLSNKEIGLQITSGWRCLDWEYFRNRSGKSQHVHAAYDAQPIGCSKAMAVAIIAWLFAKYNDRKTGHSGGFAIKKPTRFKSKPGVEKVGFVHFDFRGYPARWDY